MIINPILPSTEMYGLELPVEEYSSVDTVLGVFSPNGELFLCYLNQRVTTPLDYYFNIAKYNITAVEKGSVKNYTAEYTERISTNTYGNSGTMLFDEGTRTLHILLNSGYTLYYCTFNVDTKTFTEVSSTTVESLITGCRHISSEGKTYYEGGFDTDTKSVIYFDFNSKTFNTLTFSLGADLAIARIWPDFEDNNILYCRTSSYAFYKFDIAAQTITELTEFTFSNGSYAYYGRYLAYVAPASNVLNVYNLSTETLVYTHTFASSLVIDTTTQPITSQYGFFNVNTAGSYQFLGINFVNDEIVYYSLLGSLTSVSRWSMLGRKPLPGSTSREAIMTHKILTGPYRYYIYLLDVTRNIV